MPLIHIQCQQYNENGINAIHAKIDLKCAYK